MKMFFAILGIGSLLSTSPIAVGGTLHVANNGTDSSACGAIDSACRSISQAIANAVAGDTILVRPGRYGDLDGDGVLGSLGEETGSPDVSAQGAVYVGKSLTILSTSGAESTRIDAGGARQAAVELAADGVRFGDKGRGFTLVGGQSYGLYTAGRTNIHVAGNSASSQFAGYVLRPGGPMDVRANSASGNSIGFWVIGFQPAEAVTLVANVATRNEVGIQSGGIAPHRIINNVASGNTAWGIAIEWGAVRIVGNQVTGNRRGLQVNSTSDQPVEPVIVRNNFVGNQLNGLDVLMGPVGGTIRLRDNNFFGNGNCGVTNQSLQAFIVDARNNYWGAPTGPSFQDPADAACVGNQPILVSPFAPTEFVLQ